MMTVKKTEKMMMKATRTVSIKTKTKMMRVTIISDIRLIKAFKMFFVLSQLILFNMPLVSATTSTVVLSEFTLI